MTEVKFYISNDTGKDAQLQLACRLSEKANSANMRTYIHTGKAEQTEEIDQLLWAFRPASFVPHATVGSEQADSAKVLIGHNETINVKADVLINLHDSIPDFYSRFDRVIEIVAGDEETRNQARQRYRFYQERGYPLETHEING